MPRYTFVDDQDRPTPSSPSSVLRRQSSVQTVPWYWTLYALALGGLAGVVFVLGLLFVLAV